MISGRLLAASLTLIATLSLPAAARAGEARSHANAVMELFTSQGCSSCPPADALFTRLSAQTGVIALAYHVNYWDYIGWTDTFGAEANSQRQRDYAKSWGSSRIYTPQVVVNGTKNVVGSRQNDVTGALTSAELPVTITIASHGDMLEVTADPQAGLGQAVVWLVTYVGAADVAIDRGENAGKVMRYSNVVNGRQVLGMWDPALGANLKLPLGELLKGPATGLAILVQQEHDGLPGPIIGAASLER